MSGRKVFTAGEVLQAADVNDFLMDQSVMVFAGTAARGSAIPSPTEGMVTYLEDSDVVEVYNGSSFVGVGGKILQVVSTTKTDTFSTSSTSYTDVTGLTASITPSATANKVFVSVSVPRGFSATNQTIMMTIADGSDNNLINADSPGNRVPAFDADFISGNEIGGMAVRSFTFLHSPSTTSSFTYKVRMLVTGGTGYVNRASQGDSDDNNQRGRGVATITLMEVAG